jgi:hypothetical protein
LGGEPWTAQGLDEMAHIDDRESPTLFHGDLSERVDPEIEMNIGKR